MSNSFIAEFAQSGVSPELAQANVSWIEGREALEAMTSAALEQIPGGHSSQYATKPVREILARYSFAEDGGWIGGRICQGAVDVNGAGTGGVVAGSA